MILSTVNAGTRASIPIILVIDDIELFCNDRRQIFLYNIFNVIMEANSPVVLIGLTTRIVSIEVTCVTYRSIYITSHKGFYRSSREES